MKPELKKLLLLNLPYLLFVYLFAKCGQTYRLAAGADASAKLLHLTSGISAAFANPLPSLHPFDLCVGVVGAVAVRLIVYSKGKNAKKYRKGEEYGSARCPAGRCGHYGLHLLGTDRYCQRRHRRDEKAVRLRVC